MRSRRSSMPLMISLMHPEIAEHADEEDEGDRDPEFGFEHLVDLSA